MSEVRPAGQRYRATVEYDGTPYAGFQRQANAPTVQQAIEEAIEKLCGQDVRLQAAGRTDSGVHALGQVVSFDLPKPLPARTVRNALNAMLIEAGERVAIVDCATVAESFSARFSAVGRRYLYRIVDRPAPVTVDWGRVWWLRKSHLDCDRMNEAAARLLGTHDFTTFRDADCQANSPIRTLDEFWTERVGDEVRVHAAARSFLHSQVRSMVGSLKLVGEGRWNADDLAAALAAARRTACGPVAPAHGLYFVAAIYPEGTGGTESAVSPPPSEG